MIFFSNVSQIRKKKMTRKILVGLILCFARGSLLVVLGEYRALWPTAWARPLYRLLPCQNTYTFSDSINHFHFWDLFRLLRYREYYTRPDEEGRGRGEAGRGAVVATHSWMLACIQTQNQPCYTYLGWWWCSTHYCYTSTSTAHHCSCTVCRSTLHCKHGTGASACTHSSAVLGLV
jgi:hypothetical protein